METAGAGPAGAGVNRSVAKLACHTLQLFGNKIEGLVPGYRHEGLDASACPVALLTPLQPTLPHHGPHDAAFGVDRAGNCLDDFAGIGILLEGLYSNQSAIFDFCAEDAPVGARVKASSLG